MISMFTPLILLFFVYFTNFNELQADAVLNVDDRLSLANFGAKEKFSIQERRFLIYDVNGGEGFNLRRDVYMRIANVVKQLRERGYNYVLVLPPWGGLYHWHREGRPPQMRLPWRRFFDIKSLSRFVPTIEFEEFLELNGKGIDLVLYLQHYAEGWDEKKGYETKFDERRCLDADRYYQKKNDKIGQFFSYGKDVYGRALKCLSIQGQSSTLVDAILRNYAKPLSILIDRAETILHDHFGDVFYWRARRSMRYAKHLQDIADEFRMRVLNSTNELDHVDTLSDNWELNKRERRLNMGGNYVCVHWRRADFLRAHHQELPSIKGAVNQITNLSRRLKLSHIFLSTDAADEEVDQLSNLLSTSQIQTHRFSEKDIGQQAIELTAGEIAIIDQCICAFAKHFVGTHASTFSFRIQEDREILGFSPESTFNRLCPDVKDVKISDCNDCSHTCEQPSKWKIVYE